MSQRRCNSRNLEWQSTLRNRVSVIFGISPNDSKIKQRSSNEEKKTMIRMN